MEIPLADNLAASTPRCRKTLASAHRLRLPVQRRLGGERAHPDVHRAGARGAIRFRPAAKPGAGDPAGPAGYHRRRKPGDSTFKLSLCTSAPHLVSSLSMSAADLAGVEVSGSPPSKWMRFFTSSVSTSLRNSALSLSTISVGVPAGASKP